MKKLDIIAIIITLGLVTNEVYKSFFKNKNVNHSVQISQTKPPPHPTPTPEPTKNQTKTIHPTNAGIIQIGSTVTCKYSITNTDTGALIADSTMEKMPTSFTITNGTKFPAIETLLLGKEINFSQKININSNELKNGELSSQLVAAFLIPSDINLTIDITVLSITPPP